MAVDVGVCVEMPVGASVERDLQGGRGSRRIALAERPEYAKRRPARDRDNEERPLEHDQIGRSPETLPAWL